MTFFVLRVAKYELELWHLLLVGELAELELWQKSEKSRRFLRDCGERAAHYSATRGFSDYKSAY